MDRGQHDELKQKLRQLRLRDMAEHLDQALEDAQKQQSGYLALVADLVNCQLTAANSRSLDRRLKKACFPRSMTFENFDWGFQPSLNVELLKDLTELSFIAQRRPLLILGKTGTGKTHIATSLGIKACEANCRVEFHSLQHLLSILYASLADDTTDEVIVGFCKLDLLIIDNVGSLRTKPEYPSLLFDLVNNCQDQTALIITSAVSMDEWRMLLGDVTISNAIIDRLMHRANIINIRKGRSYRTQGPQAPQPANDNTPKT